MDFEGPSPIKLELIPDHVRWDIGHTMFRGFLEFRKQYIAEHGEDGWWALVRDVKRIMAERAAERAAKAANRKAGSTGQDSGTGEGGRECENLPPVL